MHSVAVEPLLDLDTALPDSKLSSDIAMALQNELSTHGPVRVTAVSDSATTSASSNSGDEEAKARLEGARTALQGTKRIKDGKLRLSLRLVNSADGKVLYRRIVETDVSGKGADTAAKLTAGNIYAVLSTAKPSPIESMEDDPGWRDRNTREILISGKALRDRRTLMDFDRAVELFQKATEAEPDSALAHSYLAEVHLRARFLPATSSTFPRLRYQQKPLWA